MLNDKIKSLIELLENSEINEIEVSTFWGHQKIKLKKNIEQVVSAISSNEVSKNLKYQELTPDVPIVKQPELSEPEVISEPNNTNADLIAITAPLVGTFYTKPKPDSDSFVSVGSKIKKGDVVCIIEAMKIFNEIESEVSGEIVEILIDDSQPVEFGQKLFHVKEN